MTGDGGLSGLVTKSCPPLATLWIVACQALLSVWFSRQGYWSGLPFPSPRDLLDLGIKSRSPELQADSCILGRFLPTELGEKPTRYRSCQPSFRKRFCAMLCLSLNHVRLLATPWTVACQAPLSMRFSMQEYWSGLPCPPPGDLPLPNPGFNPRLLHCRGILYQLCYQWRDFSIILIFIALEVFLKR